MGALRTSADFTHKEVELKNKRKKNRKKKKKAKKLLQNLSIEFNIVSMSKKKKIFQNSGRNVLEFNWGLRKAFKNLKVIWKKIKFY